MVVRESIGVFQELSLFVCSMCLMRMRTNYRVRDRIKFCAAMEERRRIPRRENLFRANAHLHFRTPQKCGKSQCTCLRIKWSPCLRPITPPRSVDSALPKLCQITGGNKSCTGGSNGTVNIFALWILSEGGSLSWCSIYNWGGWACCEQAETEEIGWTR